MTTLKWLLVLAGVLYVGGVAVLFFRQRLEAPYTSTVDVAASLFPVAPVSLLMRDQFHSDRRIGRVTAPLLVMHGDADPAINIRFGERLFAMAHQPKQFARFAGGGHENLDEFGAMETVRRFIRASID